MAEKETVKNVSIIYVQVLNIKVEFFKPKKIMKKIVLLFTLVMFSLQSYTVGAVPNEAVVGKDMKSEKDVEFSQYLSQMTPEEIMVLTPEKYKEKTGKKIGLKNALKLKMAKRLLKKAKKAEAKGDGTASGGIGKGLYIVLAILGLAWIAMGIFDDWKGNTWIIGLVLALLLWLPGLIFALIKMKDYY